MYKIRTKEEYTEMTIPKLNSEIDAITTQLAKISSKISKCKSDAKKADLLNELNTLNDAKDLIEKLLNREIRFVETVPEKEIFEEKKKLNYNKSKEILNKPINLSFEDDDDELTMDEPTMVLMSTKQEYCTKNLKEYSLSEVEKLSKSDRRREKSKLNNQRNTIIKEISKQNIDPQRRLNLVKNIGIIDQNLKILSMAD